MLASGLEPKERADMLVKYVDALLELYPSWKAVVVVPSRKFLSRETIENHPDKAVTRFIYYAVNVRYFSIQEMCIRDRLCRGCSILHLYGYRCEPYLSLIHI